MAAFASRGYSIDQPLAVAPQDLPNTFADLAAGTPLANLVADALRAATRADIGFTANAMIPRPGQPPPWEVGRAGTVYDVISLASRPSVPVLWTRRPGALS